MHIHPLEKSLELSVEKSRGLGDVYKRQLAWTGDRRGCEAVLDRGYVGRS